MKHLLITMVAVVVVGCWENNDVLLHKAAEQGDLNDVKLYLEKGSNKNFKNGRYNDTPLHRAIFSENENLVIYLVSNDVDINALDALGTTPLDDAYLWGNKKIIRFIRQNGGKTGRELGADEVSTETVHNIRQLKKKPWGHFLILSLFCPIFAIGFYVKFYKNRDIHLRLKSTKVTPINILFPGYVEVSGRAETNEEYLISPWGKSECIYYKFLVERWVASGSGKGGAWKTYLQETKCLPFSLNDDTGKVKIDKTKAVDFELRIDNEFQTGSFTKITKELREVLKKHKRGDLSWGSDLRFTEKTIYPYEEIYAFGNALKSKDGWVLGSKNNIPLIISDKGESSVQKRFWNEKYVSLTLMLISLLGVLIGLNGLYKNNVWIAGVVLLIYFISTSIVFKIRKAEAN